MLSSPLKDKNMSSNINVDKKENITLIFTEYSETSAVSCQIHTYK